MTGRRSLGAMMGRCVGIDLGTTYSAVAHVTDAGVPEVITNREGEAITASVVLFQEEEPLIGSMAKRAAATAPDDHVQFVKRNMGEGDWRFVTQNGQEFRAEEISALIIKRLAADAELQLGEPPITDVVVTVPAYFDDARRSATRDAGELAGLKVRRVLNEPTAAALAYGFDQDFSGTLLVYDLGGGTFDVTIMRVDEGTFEVLATGGDPSLGGFDWDNAVMNWLNERFMEAGGSDLLEDPASVVDLRDKTEMAKRALTSVDRTRVTLGSGGHTESILLTRDTFDQLTGDLLRRTRDYVEDVREEVGLGWAEIDRLLLVGGSTRMPQVRSMIEELSGLTPERSINPDEVVALGAAVQADLVNTDDVDRADAGSDGAGSGPDLLVRDVTSQSLGVEALEIETHQPVNTIIVPRNSRIPTKASQLFSTHVDGQTSLAVSVTEGDDVDLAYVREVGRKDIPIPPYPRGAPVEVFIAYDIDQTVFIEVYDRTADRLLGSFELDRAESMSERDLVAGRERIGQLEIG